MSGGDSGGSGGLTATELLWGQQGRSKPGPKPSLTVAAIAHAGIEIADADGLTGVTMQRVAEALGVTKMALYRYVPGKIELVALMTDASLALPAPLETAGVGWRSALEALARQMFERFCRHPWLLEATVGARAFGPNEIDWIERTVTALADTELDGGEMLDVTVTLVGHIRNIAQQSAAFDSDSPERITDDALGAIMRGRECQFPALAAALGSAVQHGSQDNGLEFGLECILDGVELLIGRRAKA